MIKVDLITGFLGSGKTTFLLKYARHLMNQGLKVGILEYDYGSINVDMVLLGRLRGSNCEIEMLAAACDRDCLERRFRTKLISMAMSGYDRVIIEPSGVFDMDMFFDALREEPLENWYEIGSVICVVNAGLGPQDEESDYILASQVASSGKVLLSRTQLVSADDIEATKLHIARGLETIGCKNAHVSYMDKCWDELNEADYRILMNAGYHIGDYVKKYDSDRNSFSSVSLLNQPCDIQTLKIKVKELFADKAYGQIERIKGFAFDQGKNYQLNITPYEENITECNAGSGVLIIIGKDLDENRIRGLIFG